MARQKKTEAAKELSFEEELERTLAHPDDKTFTKLCKLRARIETQLATDPTLAELFFRVNSEMGKVG